MAENALKPPPAYPGMAVGLFGGSFDPAHEGHLHVSKIALKRLGLDRLWWLVSPGNPLKDKARVSAFGKRLSSARALARHPRIDVTGFEAALPGPYSADTVAFLRRRYPGVHFVWVMGADNLATFHRWERWRALLRAVPVAAIDRPGYRLAARAGRAAHVFDYAYVEESDAAGLKLMAPPAWTLLTAPLSALSSTALRARPGGAEGRY